MQAEPKKQQKPGILVPVVVISLFILAVVVYFTQPTKSELSKIAKAKDDRVVADQRREEQRSVSAERAAMKMAGPVTIDPPRETLGSLRRKLNSPGRLRASHTRNEVTYGWCCPAEWPTSFAQRSESDRCVVMAGFFAPGGGVQDSSRPMEITVGSISAELSSMDTFHVWFFLEFPGTDEPLAQFPGTVFGIHINDQANAFARGKKLPNDYLVLKKDGWDIVLSVEAGTVSSIRAVDTHYRWNYDFTR